MRVLMWPFRLIWSLLGLMGRLTAALLGVVLLIVGIILTVTVIGSVVGVPLAIIGFLLLIRSLF